MVFKVTCTMVLRMASECHTLITQTLTCTKRFIPRRKDSHSREKSSHRRKNGSHRGEKLFTAGKTFSAVYGSINQFCVKCFRLCFDLL